MKTKIIFTGLAGIGVCACQPQSAQAKKPADAKPNVLVIFTDDMGVGDVSFLNNGWVTTPNIDRLAAQGLVITNFYVAAPVSSPSRAGLTTGIAPLEIGFNTFLHTRAHNAQCEQYDYLDPSLPSMGRAFKNAGYATAHIGKWHMGGGRDVTDAPNITAYGFDEYLTTYEGPDPDPKITATDWIWSPEDEVKRWDRSGYFVDKALDFIKRNKDTDKPFFMNFWPDDMHTPFVFNEASQANNKTWSTPANFREVLAEYDRQIGRLMSGLKKLGVDKNTIIIFTSDNGPMPYYKQQRTNGLRSMKCSLYEGGIRMPFAISWPAKIAPRGIDRSSVVCTTDLLPSLCAMAGVPLPADSRYSGEDMSAALTGNPQTRTKDLMWEFGRNDNFYNQHEPQNKSPHLGIRRGNMKLMINSFDDAAELYDLSKDPNETTNLAAANPELVAGLRQTLLEWWDKRPIKTVTP